MNKTIIKLAIAGLACATLFETACAAPKGNHRGNAGHPARTVQRTTTVRTTKTVVKTPPAPARHATTPRHGNRPPTRAIANCRPTHHQAPTRHCLPHRHHLPHGARYWARPAVPCWRIGALHPWEWVIQEWVIIVNGICYYGDGYYFDGCNYFYNGTYHTTPPTVVIVT